MKRRRQAHLRQGRRAFGSDHPRALKPVEIIVERLTAELREILCVIARGGERILPAVSRIGIVDGADVGYGETQAEFLYRGVGAFDLVSEAEVEAKAMACVLVDDVGNARAVACVVEVGAILGGDIALQVEDLVSGVDLDLQRSRSHAGVAEADNVFARDAQLELR